MAGSPQAPPQPTYVSSTSTTITIQIQATLSTNGSPITRYEIWRDLGSNDAAGLTTNVTSYDGKSMQFQI